MKDKMYIFCSNVNESRLFKAFLYLFDICQYTKPEIHELLVSGLPGERSEQFKGAYISMILPIFYFVSRLVREGQSGVIVHPLFLFLSSKKDSFHYCFF